MREGVNRLSLRLTRIVEKHEDGIKVGDFN